MVIKHVYFQLKDAATLSSIVQQGKRLLPGIPGVLFVSFRQALPGQEQDQPFPYFIEVHLDSMELHEAYLTHPDHVEFSETCFKPYVTEVKRVFFQEAK